MSWTRNAFLYGLALGWMVEGCDAPRVRDDVDHPDDYDATSVSTGDTDAGRRLDGGRRLDERGRGDGPPLATRDAADRDDVRDVSSRERDSAGGHLPDGSVRDAESSDGPTSIDADAGRPDTGPQALDGRPRDAVSPDVEPPRPDAALVPDVLTVDGRDLRDREPPDSAIPDASMPDGSHVDGSLEADGALVADAIIDGSEMDIAADADAYAPDGARPDVHESPDSAVAAGHFVEGIVLAADRQTPVTVRAGELTVIAAVDGHFVLGPLDPGGWTVEFEAPDHQGETVEVSVSDHSDTMLEALVLYRGTRVSASQGRRLRFSGNDGWFIWENDATLYATPTDALDPRVLSADHHEVYLGLSPDGEAVVARHRTEPILAGDIDLIPFDGGEPVPLFIEAQPWVRWVGDRVLAMVQTRGGLSRLESAAPGEPQVVLALGVPWLFVTVLNDGMVVWASGEGPGFAIWRGRADGSWSEQLSAEEGPASEAFLMTTPGRAGVMWMDPESRLWRWTPGLGTMMLGQAVLASPRPRFLGNDGVMFWRAEEGATQSAFVWEEGSERLLVEGAVGHSMRVSGEGFYVIRPDRGLYRGRLDGSEAGEVLMGHIDGFTGSGDGVVALVDGAPWRYAEEVGAERLGEPELTDLSSVQYAPFGATAWAEATRTLWWLPGPGQDHEPTALVRGADRPGRMTASGGNGIYVLGPDGYRSVLLPPREGGEVMFDAPILSIVVVDAERLLGLDRENGLWQVNPQTGRAFAWASHVVLLERSIQRNFAAYVCDRGVFLAPIPGP